MIAPNNEIGFELLKEIEPDEDGNLFISPTSLFMALSMIYNGAEGSTKEEIAQTLKLDGIETEALNKANASLMNRLQKDSDSIQLDIANSIWLNKEFHFQEAFSANNQNYFNAEIEEIDIGDAASADKINKWVANATNDKITEMVTSPLNPNMVTYLLNAVYFKGDWTYAFEEEITKNEPFYLDDGTTKEVPLMSLTEELGYMENDMFQAVELPYGDGEMNMKVFLPKAHIDIKAFQNELTIENWKMWHESFEEKKGTVQLPRFQLDYEVLLNDALRQLGMASAFEEDADFSKMIQENNPIWISMVKQKTFLDVNEKGTEAAAVTGIEFETTAMPLNEPFTMKVNRPFFIAITDTETEAIIFMGIITNPQEGK
ncbi:hypothetical protein BI350_16130 [Sporosarcina ureilytica]|uniref:Serpin domain-containing protein n=2 Tax=Sporosarcina ureilytica TaxID=298596 RepID=A0A1D8JKQ1_9BACL|nr:hypothetical protein BI350_16130 [Sporosarcina ureilytica]